MLQARGWQVAEAKRPVLYLLRSEYGGDAVQGEGEVDGGLLLQRKEEQ